MLLNYCHEETIAEAKALLRTKLPPGKWLIKRQGVGKARKKLKDIHAMIVHRCRSRKLFWGAKNFFPNFPKLARNVFVRLLPTNFSHKEHEDLFLVRPLKRS